MKFRRASRRYGKTPVPETPYQRAGQLWDERIGSARLQARNWRLMAFGGLLLSAMMSAGLLWQSAQSRIVPYVVEVDRLGEARSVAPAIKNYRPTDGQVAWHLSRFIANVRSIPLDPVLMRENWLSAYDFASGQGAQFLNEHARAAAPFDEVGKKTVSVQVTSVVRASDRSFQVKWTERRYERGSPAGTSRWTAILTVAVKPPASADALRKNPLGLFVEGIDWSRELDPAGAPAAPVRPHDPAPAPAPPNAGEPDAPISLQSEEYAMNLSIAAILYVLAAASASGTVPTPAGLSVHRWVEGAVYPLAAAPGQLSLVTLEPGEKLVSVAAGDTAQWVIGDTVSGSGATLRAQLLIKPVAAGLRTNMVIATDRRVYQLALESRAHAPLASLRWSYAAPSLIALKAPPEPACRPSLDLAALNFNYRIKGDVTSWRPLRAFDDGRQTFIEFPATIGQAEAPPLFLRGEDGGLELVNYRVKGRFYVVDRIFAAAELRIGEKKQQKVEIVRTAAKPMPSRRAK